MQVLLKPKHREMEILESYERVQDRIAYLIHVFEKVMELQKKTAEVCQAGQRKGDDSHEYLDGWNFVDLARKEDLEPLMETIPAAYQSWTKIVRKLDTVILFGTGFGDLIEPEDSCNLCNHWKRVPTNQHLLATLTSDFDTILELLNDERLEHSQTLLKGILKHHPNNPVPPCPCKSAPSLEQAGSALKHAEPARIMQLQTPGSDSSTIYWNREETRGAILLGIGSPGSHTSSACDVTDTSLPVPGSGSDSNQSEADSALNLHRTHEPVKSVASSPSLLSPKGQFINHGTKAQARIVPDKINNRQPPEPKYREDFQVAVLCALPVEAEAVEHFFDRIWTRKTGQHHNDKNTYTLGHVGRHNVVLVHMSGMGTNNAKDACHYLAWSFGRIKLRLVVGICGGIPFPPSIPFPPANRPKEILLGDVVISTDLVQYDLGKQYPAGFVRKGNCYYDLSRADGGIRPFLFKFEKGPRYSMLTENTTLNLKEVNERYRDHSFHYPGLEKDRLYDSIHRHQHQDSVKCTTCVDGITICSEAIKESCDKLECHRNIVMRRDRLEKAQKSEHPTHTDIDRWIHFGCIASGNTVMKSAEHRDKKAQEEGGILAFEMEGAGAWEGTSTIVVKGVCDYADSHKNDDWHDYAAGSAAACMKALLEEWPVFDYGRESTDGHLKHPLSGMRDWTNETIKEWLFLLIPALVMLFISLVIS
ncbi:hypothetical protein E8E13_008562 [Curvularia kusanoi]|uniref:Nucleoside phosphorylase domain-containing protein n=1 Tax=Curvularia kusanoi TaxID=90978 RepID=A0A9P4TCD2_CURKU|nr:hypothetical protein E8E13_008562 [Curvularia kusanoi]